MHHFLDLSHHPELWEESIKIYNDSFPEWEREDTANILKNIQNSTYKMFSYIENEEVLGFYILDINTTLNYALFSFLAVKDSKRGEGIGSKLCLNAIEYFHKELKEEWFLTEAQERQAQLYEKLGFSRLTVDYRVPAFNSQESIKMNLMLIKKSKTLGIESLKNIVRDIFSRGYSLEESDVRIKEQLERLSHY
ncbi:MAG: GNAT family N-acetyltransferase [Campylobacterota bacterium]|nr:GNAT family N-acetyltransferase [Campylobacterota bacterium]